MIDKGKRLQILCIDDGSYHFEGLESSFGSDYLGFTKFKIFDFYNRLASGELNLGDYGAALFHLIAPDVIDDFKLKKVLPIVVSGVYDDGYVQGDDNGVYGYFLNREKDYVSVVEEFIRHMKNGRTYSEYINKKHIDKYLNKFIP